MATKLFVSLTIIVNFTKHWEALGFAKDASSGLAEEFLWNEYRNDGCNKSIRCMQSKIIEYLKTQSAIFYDDYKEKYKAWIGSCLDDALQEKTGCTDCFMHPKPLVN